MELFPTPNVKISYQDDVATLVIKRMTTEQAGVYKCQATNDAGEDEIEAKVVTESKQVAPKINTPLQTVSKQEGHPVSLRLGFTGAPKPTVQW